MPDKKAYIDEMMRVLKPGGKFVMATWCQRDDKIVPFDKRDKRDLKFLYEEWYVCRPAVRLSLSFHSYLSFGFDSGPIRILFPSTRIKS